jgi:hypothetical protein
MNDRAETTSSARETVLAAALLLKALRSDGLDDFLLELGLPNPQVGRAANLRARIESLQKYALVNPHLKTASGENVGDAIVARAVSIAAKYQGSDAPNVSGEERQAFHDALARQQLSGPLQDGERATQAPAEQVIDRTNLENVIKFLRDWALLLGAVGALLVAAGGLLADVAGFRSTICTNSTIPMYCPKPCTIDTAIREGCR